MSLQVWLPLTGDTNNNGVLKTDMTTYGSNLFADDGKLGKCFNPKVDNDAVRLMNIMPILSTYKQYSICAWVYVNKAATNHSSTIISSGNWNSSQSQFCFGVYGWNAGYNGYTVLLYPNLESWNRYISLQTPIVVGKWYHIAITYDGNTTTAYINGKEEGSVNKGGITATSESKHAYVGSATYYSGFTLKGKMNDFRIYDHCLSVKELQEINKSLIVHYRLDHGTALRLEGKTFGTEYDCTGNGYNGTFTSPNNVVVNYNTGTATWNDTEKCYEITSPVTTSTWGSGFYIQQSLVNVPYGATYRISFYMFIEKSSKIQIDINNTVMSGTAWNGNDNDDSSGHRTSTAFTIPANQWYRVEWGSTNIRSNNTEHIAILPYDGVGLVTSGNTETIKWKMRDLNITVDNHYCIMIGHTHEVTQADHDSPKYELSTVFNSGSYIDIPNINFTAVKDSYSFSWWSKIPDMSGKMAWGFSDGNRLNVYPSTAFCWNTGDGSSNRFKSDSGVEISFTPYNNAWHHYVVTGDGTVTRLYIDGEYVGKASTYKPLTGTKIRISGWDTGGSYKWNGGLLSDFRIYGKTLSDAEIQDLYDTCAAVDLHGNVYGYEFNEVDQ